MEAVDLGSVLEFLSKHGFTKTELALEEDMKEKENDAYDLEKFLFVLPQLRIGPSFPSPWRTLSEDIIGSDTNDEFVSLVTSTEDDCSSEFINPYGNQSSVANSATSSDRLSQFGTAREYPDVEFKKYDDKEDDQFMTPCFSGQDYFKFEAGHTTSDESENPMCVYDESEGLSNVDYLDKPCLTDAEFNLNAISDDKASEVNIFAIETESEDLKTKEEDDDKEPDTSLEDLETFNLRIVHRKNRTGFEEAKEFPIVMNTIIAGRYYVKEYLGSAAFSRVVKACDLQSGIDVCLKIIKNDKDFFDQSLDEIKLLKLVNFNDPSDERHILRLYDYFYHQEHLFIVCELLKDNLHEFQKFNEESGDEPYFTNRRLQIITRQCLEALEYLHELGIIHCDLKPENIMIKSYTRCEVKVIDLGSSCFKNDNLCSYVQSRSYRAPEVILGLPYDEKIDVWSLGCILAELHSGEVLFPNHPMVMILARMVGMFGGMDAEMLTRGQETSKYFSEEYDLYYLDEETNEVEYMRPEDSVLEDVLRNCDMGFIQFVKCLLQVNPSSRPTARQALSHPWLSSSS